MVTKTVSFRVFKSLAYQFVVGSTFEYFSDGKDYRVTKVEPCDDDFVRIFGEEVTDD